MLEEIRKLSSSEAQRLALAFLLTDGDVRRIKSRNRIQATFASKDPHLHELFVETMNRAFNRKPAAFLYKGKRCLRTTFEFSCASKEAATLFRLSPSFRTKDKPTIRSILSGTKRLKTLSLRIAFAADGNVSMSRGKPRLKLGCSNPELNSEWQQLAMEMGIDMNVCRDRNTWSGIQGLTTDKKDNIKRFSELGGFAPHCKAYKSKKFSGWDKNDILERIQTTSAQWVANGQK